MRTFKFIYTSCPSAEKPQAPPAGGTGTRMVEAVAVGAVVLLLRHKLLCINGCVLKQMRGIRWLAAAMETDSSPSQDSRGR